MFVVALNNVDEADIHTHRRRLKLRDSAKKGRNDPDPNQVKVKVDRGQFPLTDLTFVSSEHGSKPKVR
jgi:hypothetical protein